MIASDYIVVISLLAFTLAWWMRGLPQRRSALLISALACLLAGLAGTFNYRWQDGVGGAVAVFFLLVLLVSKWRQKPPAPGLLWKSGTAIGLLAAIAIAPIYLFPVTDIPPPSGEHSVGTRNFELSDKSRLGVFAAAADEPRRLLVRVWYPAADTSDLKPRPYFTDAEADSTAAGLGQVFGMPFLFQYLKHSMTNAYTNAPIATAAADLPVIMYSHGYASFAGQNTALMEELASHGYVVYSVQHSYDSAPTLFPNGDVLPMDPALLKMMRSPPKPSAAMTNAMAGATLDERYQGQLALHKEARVNADRIAQSAPVWLADRLFVLDTLQSQRVPESVQEIVAASDFNATGELGMSFGGSTSGGLCMVDSRCMAGVNLDGGDFHTTPFGHNMPVPFMMFYSDFSKMAKLLGVEDNGPPRGMNDFSYERPELAGMREDIHRLTTKNLKHLGISDFTLFTRNPVKAALFGSIDASVIIQIQNDFVRGFFDTYLRGEDVGFPHKQYERHARWTKPDTVDDVQQWWLSAHPDERVERVILETESGEIELALYPGRAPIAVKNFLANVDAGRLDGASLYRAARSDKGQGISIVQVDVSTLALKQGLQASESWVPLLPGVAYDTSLNPEGPGNTAFGRVVRGLRVFDKLPLTTTDTAAGIQPGPGQLLGNSVKIQRAHRIHRN